MAGTHDLYALIATLTRTEKRYCTMALEEGAGRRAASCRRLFEIICAMDAPDDALVRDAVRDEPFAGHLAVTKNHLHEHLLRSLRSFSAKGTRARIRALIEGAEVLADRGLHEQARRRLRDAWEPAERLGYLPEMLVMLRQEWRIDANEGYVGVRAGDLQERRARAVKVARDVANYWDYLHLLSVASMELLQHGPVVAGRSDRLDEMVRAPMLELSRPATLPARRFQLETMRLYHMLTARYEEGFAHSVRYLRYAEEFPPDERMEQLNYGSLLHTHVIVSLKTGRLTEASAAFEKLCALEPRSRLLRAQYRNLRFCCRLELLMVHFDADAMAAMAPELDEICRTDANGFTRQLRIGYAIDLACALFVNGRLDDAIDTLHPVINDNRPGFRDDALCMARLLQLMIHHDRGDAELLPYLIRSTYRFISRCRGVSDVDRIVLRFMRRLANVPTHEALIAAFVGVRSELAAVVLDPAVYETSAMCMVLPWLDAAIAGRPFGEVAREAQRRLYHEDVAEPVFV